MSVAASMVQTLQALPRFATDLSNAEIDALVRALHDALHEVKGVARSRMRQGNCRGHFPSNWYDDLDIGPPRGAA